MSWCTLFGRKAVDSEKPQYPLTCYVYERLPTKPKWAPIVSHIAKDGRVRGGLCNENWKENPRVIAVEELTGVQRMTDSEFYEILGQVGKAGYTDDSSRHEATLKALHALVEEQRDPDRWFGQTGSRIYAVTFNSYFPDMLEKETSPKSYYTPVI
ncbi:hypothetical protein FQN57_000534 [Myotisia sp. PD_48]|nr:hypothetical protein FQN57_000534 [Myotisia sp. PD_48]